MDRKKMAGRSFYDAKGPFSREKGPYGTPSNSGRYISNPFPTPQSTSRFIRKPYDYDDYDWEQPESPTRFRVQRPNYEDRQKFTINPYDYEYDEEEEEDDTEERDRQRNRVRRKFLCRPEPFSLASAPITPGKGFVPPRRLMPLHYNIHGAMEGDDGEMCYLVTDRNVQVWKKKDEISKESIDSYVGNN